MVDKVVNKLHVFHGTVEIPQLSITDLHREPDESSTLSHTPILQDIIIPFSTTFLFAIFPLGFPIKSLIS
jgi:hypothetical protein